MRWVKQGRIFVPDGSRAWAQAYAFPPTPHLRSHDVIRIFVGLCDDSTVSRVGYVDVAADDPREVLRVSAEPVLDIGEAGAFDDNGVVPTCVVELADRLYLYYVGFQLGRKLPYFQFQGLAESTDGGESFRRVQRTPVLERSDAERLHRTSAFVERTGGGTFRMWYVGGSAWTVVAGKPLPVYNLRYAESADGRRWPGEGRVVLDFANEDEHAFGRPWIFRTGGGPTRMFYSVRTRSNGYRIGCAESEDELTWTRKDDSVGITVSPEGWDAEMVAYTSLVRWNGRVYLFYCGNGRGRSGFGYALLEEW